MIVDGWAKDFATAVECIAHHLNADAPTAQELARVETRARTLLPAPALPGAAATFGADGKTLTVTPGMPRPYSHVIANNHGAGAVMTAEGDIFSFTVNARQNSLTPFRMGEGRFGPSGQAIYVRDMASGDTDCATFAPLRRKDGKYEAEFGLGYVVYRRTRADLDLELTVFAPPGRTCETNILRIVNKTAGDRIFNVAPIAEIALDETMVESQGSIQIRTDDNGCALYFRNPKNHFAKGWAFASTSLAAEFAETSRQRAYGPNDRGTRVPYMVEHCHPVLGNDRRQRTVAAFCGPVEVKAGGEAKIVFSLGQTGGLAEAAHFAEVARGLGWATHMLAETKAFWAETLGVLRIETNKPEFDRLVNDWLPYQLLASRLWGRTGPAQRSGATGYRDQLQDVLPLVLLAPELARRQILLHAARQFIEGDAVKWWHTAPGGGTGLADRTIASDPHLWLPFVTLRYVQATGDDAVLDVETGFIETALLPKGVESNADVPLPSRESAKLFDHCRLAIEWTLARFGRNGLPLMGAGDWDDGMNLIGLEGRGESVWVGFFLHGILVDFAKLCDKARQARSRRALSRHGGQAARGARQVLARRPLSARLCRQRQGSDADERDGRLLAGHLARRGFFARRGERRKGAERAGAARPHPARQSALRRTVRSLPRPLGRISAGRARERRAIFARRFLVRGRAGHARRTGAGQGRRQGSRAAVCPRLQVLVRDFAAVEICDAGSRRTLRPAAAPAGRRRLRGAGLRGARRLGLVHGLGGAHDDRRLCAARPATRQGRILAAGGCLRSEGRAAIEEGCLQGQDLYGER